MNLISSRVFSLLDKSVTLSCDMLYTNYKLQLMSYSF